MKKIALLTLALACSFGLFAQHNEEVTIEGTYRPKVNKVDKLLIKPETPQQSFEMPDTKVHLLEVEHRFPLELEPLSAFNFSDKEGFHKPAKNFLMVGFGSRLSPVFLYKHNSKLTKNLGLGVGLKHYSSWFDMKDYAPSRFMNNALEVGLTGNASNNLLWNGKVFYKNDVYRYYGVKIADLPVGISIDQAAPRETYNTIGAHFGLASTTTRNGEFVHTLGLDYHYLFGKVDGGGSEHVAQLDYDLEYADSWWGKKHHPQKVGLALGVQYGHDEFPGKVGEDRLVFKANPYFEMKDDFYRLHLGVRLDGGTKFNTTAGLLSVHPDVNGSLLVLNNRLEFYAGLSGGRKLVSYRDMMEENPFVAPHLDMEVTTVKLGFEGGLRAHLMNTLDVHVGVRYRHTQNDPFYVVFDRMLSGYLLDNMFEVFYDESRLTSVTADIRWLAFDKLTIDAGATFNNYRMTVLDHPLYRPKYEARLKVDYSPMPQLSLFSTFLFQEGRYARNSSPYLLNPSFKLKPMMDLGLGADYRFNDQLAVFVKINNLLHQKYQLYYNYPVNGIEFFAGLKMTF